MSDDVDQILEQWRNKRPDIDPSPMELTGRLQRAAVFTREQLTSNFTAAGLEPGQFDVLATIYRAAGKAGALTAGELETHLENCRAVAERLDVEEVQQLNRLLAKMLPADPD